MSTPKNYAFVTLLTSDSYLPGALVLAASLREVHPQPPTPPDVPFQTVCIVTPETVDVKSIKALRGAFDVVIGVEVIEEAQNGGLQLLGRPDLHLVLTKLHIFRLTQYEKIIFLDADILPLRPLSHLFTLEHEFSAVPDVGWPDIFNSGMMVLSPGEDKFNQVMDLVKSRGSWDGADQGILNEWRGWDWNRLSFTYNTTPTAAYTYAPAYERFGSQISAIHFIGPNKPWSGLPWRAPGSTSPPSEKAPTTQRAYAYSSLVDRWYNVYDRHYRVADAPVVQGGSFEPPKYAAAWDTPTSEQVAGPGETITVHPFGLDELKRLAVEGMGAAAAAAAQEGEGEYRSLPLEGRLDLMRPAPPPPPPAPEHKDTQIQSQPQPSPFQPPPPPSQSQYHHQQQHEPQSSQEPQSYYQAPAHEPQYQPPAQHDYHDAPPQTQWQPQPQQQQQPQQQAAPSHQQYQQPQTQPPPPPQPQRPPSPPMISWNPAVEPPPSTRPPNAPQEAVETYYTNVWDMPTRPYRPYDSEGERPKPQDPDSFFHAPPRTTIPERLVREGHYSNVTSHQPDKQKVQIVFPWENQARRNPGRVFPRSESPPPSFALAYVEPAIPQPPPRAPSPPSPVRPSIYWTDNPVSGPPGSMIYGNAWDNVPSIQRYVSRLARPASFLPVDLPPPTPPSHFRRQSKTFAEAPEPGEASSRDGDDEDEIGESEADEPVIVGKHDKGHKGVDAAVGNSKAPGVRSPPKPRSRSGSKSGSGSGSRSSDGKSRYRSFGIQAKPNTTEREVQTLATPPTTRSPRVSTALPVATPSPSNKGKGPQPWPMHPATQPTVLSHTGYAPGETVPTGVTSPRMHDYAFSSPSNFAAPQAQNAIASTPSMISPPDITASPLANTDVHLRGSSSDSYLTSASTASSLPVQSPIDEQSVPRRVPAGRKWDPARGVDIFKRDSQEVLAKFLRMGSWENQQTVG